MKAKLKVVRNLKNLDKRIKAVKSMYDITYLTGKISRDMKKEVDMRFRNEVDTDGRPWKGLIRRPYWPLGPRRCRPAAGRRVRSPGAGQCQAVMI